MSTAAENQDYPNETIQLLLHRRTIRAFEDAPVDPETTHLLERAAQRAATSSYLNAWSAIKITDKSLAHKLAEIGNQNYIAQAALLFVFIIDLHRNDRIAKEKGVNTAENNDLRAQHAFNQAWDDAVLALHSMQTAAESLGLGTVVLGSLLNDSEQLIELLHLPELTFPILGLAIGHPAQEPALKPRMDTGFQIFENQYPSDEELGNLSERLSDFDTRVHQYYDLRDTKKPVDRFTDQAAAATHKPGIDDKAFTPLARKQGFKF